MYILFFRDILLQKIPKWKPLPVKAIDKLKKRISANNLAEKYIGRLSLFIHGYTSAIASLIQIKSGIVMIYNPVINENLSV